jgi:hypothetical protein
VEGLDYYLNKDLRFFRLLNSSLPPDTSLTGVASLQVTYRPVRQASIAGQRNVMGVDTTMRLTRNGTIGIQLGQSESPVDSQSGLAMKVTTNWMSPGSGDRNRWKFGLTYNDVDAEFSTIDSTAGAFLQAQRGYNANFSFSPQKYVEFNTAFNQASVANKDYTLSTTPGVVDNSKLVWANNQGINFGVSMNYPRLPTVKLTHQQTTQTGGGVDFKSLYQNTALDLGYAVTKTLQLTAGLGRTTAKGRSVFSTAYNNSVTGIGSVTGGTIIDQIQSSVSNRLVTNSSSDYNRFGINFTPFATLSLTGSIGFSRDSSGSSNGSSDGSTTDSSSSTTSRARTMSFGLTAQPLPNMNVTFNYMDGNNGRSTAGFYNPNSGSGGSSIIPVTDSGQSTRSRDFNWQYTPWQFLTLNYVNRHYLSLIPGYDNTINLGNTYAITLRPKSWLDLTFNMTDQRLQYVGGQGDSKNNTMFLQATIGPIGRTQFSAGMSRTRFDSATYYSTGSGNTTPGYSGTGGTSFGNRLNGTGVLQAGVNTTYALELQYDVFKKRMLVLGWQTLDQSTPGGEQNNSSSNSLYRSQTNFNQGIGTIGFAVPIDRIMKFQVNYNLTNLRDRDNFKNSYRANTFSANLGASF